MKKRRSERAIEDIIKNIYANVELPKGNEPIKKEILQEIIKNIAMEIAKAKSVANQAMY